MVSARSMRHERTGRGVSVPWKEFMFEGVDRMERYAWKGVPLLAIVGGAFLVAGCSGETGVTGMDTEELVTAAHTVVEEEQVCVTADLDGYVHGDVIDPLEVDFGGSIGTIAFDLEVTSDVYTPNGAMEATAWDVDADINHSDEDLLTPDEGFCEDCAGHGRILILADDDFDREGDIDAPMVLTVTRDDGEEFLIRQVDIFDQEDKEGIRLLRDGTEVIPFSASISGDGEVAENVEVNDLTTFGASWVFETSSSGALDEPQLCVEEPEEGGGEGCTPGYWRQRHHFDDWTGYAPGDDLAGVFDIPADLELARPERDDPEDISLHDAVTLRGGGVNALLRHAVAALLNAASDDVSYDLTESQVISRVNDALADGEFEGLKDELETFNEQGCPL